MLTSILSISPSQNCLKTETVLSLESGEDDVLSQEAYERQVQHLVTQEKLAWYRAQNQARRQDRQRAGEG